MRALACLALAACFHPDLSPGDPCAADDHDWCPPPLTCSNHVCVQGAAGDARLWNDAMVLPYNVVFVTHDPYPLPHQLNPNDALAEADGHCNDAAAAANLSGHFVAWLSTATTSAVSRIAEKRGWVRPDGAPFADSFEDIMLGKIVNPPDIDENGKRIDLDTGGQHINDLFFVATGTMEGGAAMLMPDETCSSWSSTSGSVLVGSALGTTTAWTQLIGNGACGGSWRLYCFQDAFLSALPPPTPDPMAKLAFVTTSGTFDTTGGAAAADALCNSDGFATGRMFKALIADVGVTPASRITHPGPWKRPDGVQVATADLTYLDAPINQTLGHVYVNEVVWTGARSLTTMGSSASTCGGWTSTSGQGQNDVTGLMSLDYPGPLAQCGAKLNVWCIEDD